MSDKTEKQVRPPYVSFKTFNSFISGLRETTVPHQIDRSVLRNLSGANQSALLGALTFLNLIDTNGFSAEKLTQLIDAKDENFSATLKEILETSYSFIFQSQVQLARATTTQVQKLFRDQAITGSTITKCIAFFLAAAKEAGITVSPHVKPPQAPRAPKGTGGKKKQANKDNREQQRPPPPPPPASEDWRSILLKKFPEFDPAWDAETQQKWFDGFNKLIDNPAFKNEDSS